MAQKTKYYRVWDAQVGNYFATGYNAKSKKELVEAFQYYISNGGDSPCKKYLRSWKQIEEHLQGAILEVSNKPFEED